MLKVDTLKYAYKENTVLNGLSFSAESGECICVLGENGAGQTTLFRCILGLLRGYKGDIYVQGENCKNLSVLEMARRISYIPQAHAPTFNYSVFQTVLMGTNAIMEAYAPRHKEQALVVEKLQLLGISHLAERGYAELSGGERQLVLIARALVQNAKVLLMDEPTANLDYGNQLRIMSQVKNLASQGYLILLSTHNPEHALRFANKALLLQDGIAKAYGDPVQILDPNTINSIYGVDVEIHSIHTSCGMVPIVVPLGTACEDGPSTSPSQI